MNVIFIRSRANDPNVFKMARLLADNNFKTSVLIWDRTGKNKDVLENKMRIRFFRIHAPYDKVTIIFYLPFWWLYEFLFLLSNVNQDTVIHACDLDTLWPAIFVKILKRGQLNYTIYDFYADNLPYKTPRIIRALFAFIEKMGLRYTHTIFLVDESRIIQISGAKTSNIVYIYNTPDEVYIKNNLKFQANKKGMIIFYAGVLHKSRGLAEIIQTIKQIDDITFIVAGNGPEQRLFKCQDQIETNKIQYIGWIPYNEVINHTLNSDCIIALYDPNIPNNRYASPNKLFEAMMCAKPIIVSDQNSMADIVRKENCGLVVPYGDIKALRTAILLLKSDPDLRRRLGQNGRSVYETKYSWNIMKERILTVYHQFDLDSFED